MLCPRCGQEAEGMARACPSCGYILPFSMRRRQTASQISQHLPTVEPRALTAPPADNAVGHLSEPTLTESHAAPAPTSGVFPDAAVQRAPASRALPPTLRPTYGAERESTLLLPAVRPEEHSGNTSSGTWPALRGLLEPEPPGSATQSAITGVHRAVLETTGSMVALSSGTLLKRGRYRLLHRFGASGATLQRDESEPPLFLASDAERPSARVLMQELPLGDLHPEQAARALQRVASRFDQPETIAGLPTLLDSFTERRKHFLVFQIPSGEVLSERLKRQGPMPEAEVIRLGLRVLDVLAQLALASPPITHGNIAADHIIMQPDGAVRLVGFSSTLLTQLRAHQPHGSAGGMHGYAAPEQQRGLADARTDIYALAAVMLFALTGKDPSLGSEPLLEPGHASHETISAELDAVLARALRPAPAQRYQSVTELREALAGLAQAPAAHEVPVSRREHGWRAPSTGGPGRSLPGAAGALRASLIERPSLARRKPTVVWIAVVALVLLSMVGGSLLYVAHSGHPADSAVPTVTADQTAVALYALRGAGVSAGELIFDGQRADGDLKRRGATALAAHDLPGALAAFRQAMTVDRADAEAAIYAADVALALGQDPVATMVVGVAFGDDTPAAESTLQGAYLAQLHANALDLLPGTTRLRILIANTGATPADATAVGELLARSIAAGNVQQIVGVIGWPAAPQTRAAVQALAASGIPVIAPAAALPDVRSPAYFALAPSDVQQGSALADAAATVLSSRRILVLADPAAPRSATLAEAFSTRTTQAYASTMVITRHETFALGHTTEFTQAVRDALDSHSDTILIAGGDVDVVELAQAVAQMAPSIGTSLRILAGTPANSPALLGAGNDQAAHAVRSQPAMMSSVSIAALAAAGEWSAIGVPPGLQPTFATDYVGQFGPAAAPGGLAVPDASAILTYDGLELLSRAVTRAAHTQALPAPAAVAAALRGGQTDGPFQGVGGALAYDGSGAPTSKALALESLRPIDSAPVGGPVLDAVVVAVLGGRSAFCAGSACVAP